MSAGIRRSVSPEGFLINLVTLPVRSRLCTSSIALKKKTGKTKASCCNFNNEVEKPETCFKNCYLSFSRDWADNASSKGVYVSSICEYRTQTRVHSPDRGRLAQDFMFYYDLRLFGFSEVFQLHM